MSETQHHAKPYIRVAAGLIQQADGLLLLGQRPLGKPWEGWWELPGGKIEEGETVLEALARELHEELGITVKVSTRWVTYIHEYPKSIVELNFCRVTDWDGQPSGRENQAITWVDPLQDISVGPLLPATEPPLRWLRLPDRYLITRLLDPASLKTGLEHLSQRLAGGIKLVQFRESEWPEGPSADSLYAAFREVLALCRQYGARCLVNSRHPLEWASQADGVHLRANDIPAAHTWQRPDGLLAVSAHNAGQIRAAQTLEPDFMVLGHVLATPSHPELPPLGWSLFEELSEQAACPVFAIGGQSEASLATARAHGAHGIAGIRQL